MFPILRVKLLMLGARMGSNIDPGPMDKSVLYDQNNHISSAIWEGQVREVFYS